MSDITIDAALAQPLDRAAVKQRDSGRGAKLSYLETHHVIRTANAIFGFGNWGHEVVELRALNAVEVEGREGKKGWHVGYLCIVKLSVEGCQATSGVGYGDATEYRNTAIVTAHELAAKEAESDALKRALKNYGDQFGLALYDKDADRAGHLTSAVRPSNGAAAFKPAANFKAWEERMGVLGVQEAAEWAKVAFEMSGIKEERMVPLNKTLKKIEEAVASGVGADEAMLQSAFAENFGGVIVEIVPF